VARAARTSGDRKINGEGRMLPKYSWLLIGGRPSAIADAIQPSQREGRLRAAPR